MGWFEKKLPLIGSVAFRGSLPPRAEQMDLPPGATAERRETPADAHWLLDVKHPTLGEASLICRRNPPPVPRVVLDFDPNLTAAECDEAAVARSGVGIRIEGTKGDLLRDRKRLLVWLGAMLGTDGAMAFDHVSTRPWSRAMLDDELSHDAAVDVSALYGIHAVSGDGKIGGANRTSWLHTHGLGALGKFDFDILNPGDAILGVAQDILRALAFASLEGKLKPGGKPFPAFRPGGWVGAIDAETFDRKAPSAERAIRDIGPDDDGVHTKNRIVICDPPRQGLARWFRRSSVRASQAMMNFPDEHVVMFFSNEATELAGARARDTFERFREIFNETRELGLPATVKIGYRVDGGGETDREHLWFEVHAIGKETVDATLMNAPFNIKRMTEGMRGHHPLTGLSDWMVMTPVGSITPRSSTPLRVIRANADLREKLRAWKAEKEATPRA